MVSEGTGRRDVLRTVATAGTVGFSGCAGLGSRLTRSRTDAVTLEYMDVSGARSESTFEPVVDRLNELSDRTVELEWSTVPYDNYRSKLFTMIGSGGAPDIAAVDQVWLGSLVDSGDLFALDNVVDEIDFGDYLAPFREAVRYRGSDYGIPITTDVRGMYWNRQLFAEAGLDPDAPPETWTELLETARRLHDPPATYGATYLTVSDRWTVALYAAGGDVLTADGTRPQFHQQAGVDAARFLDDLYNDAAVGPPNPRYEDGAQNARQFLSGEYAVDVVDGSWLHAFWPQVRETEIPIEERFGFAPTPHPAGEGPATMSGGFVWTGFETTDHPELVKAFLRLVGDRPFKRRVATDSRRIPTRESLLDEDRIWAEIPYAETKRALLEHTRTRPVRNWMAVANRLDRALQQVGYDQQEPKPALDRAATEVYSLL